MVVLDEYKFKLGELTKTLEQANAQMRPDELKTELKGLEDQMSAADFWNDVDAANKVTQRVKSIKNKLDRLDKLNGSREDVLTLIEMAEEEDDESIIEEIKTELEDLEKRVSALRLEMLLKGPYDAYNCVLSLHAGAGGTEAQDWTEMLYRMYSRYCERRGWSVKEIDLLMGDDAGIKSVTFEVDGENAYGYLKAEKGVHRLVRISPFDANARRHTSFSSLDVTPIFDDDNNDIKIDPEDLRVDTYRSGGAGGQNVNKVSSAIRITHLPTGIVVQSHGHRGPVPERAEPAAEQGDGHAHFEGPPAGAPGAGAGGSDGRAQGRHEEDRMGQPDPLLRVPALHPGQGPPDRRGERQHPGRHGRGSGRVYFRVSGAELRGFICDFFSFDKGEKVAQKEKLIPRERTCRSAGPCVLPSRLEPGIEVLTDGQQI